jgi:hypothetical protein
MAPPLIFLFFVIVVGLIIVGGALIAIRTGLWVKQTDPDTPTRGDEPLVGREAEEAERAEAPTASHTQPREERERAYGAEAAADERFDKRAVRDEASQRNVGR